TLRKLLDSPPQSAQPSGDLAETLKLVLERCRGGGTLVGTTLALVAGPDYRLAASPPPGRPGGRGARVPPAGGVAGCACGPGRLPGRGGRRPARRPRTGAFAPGAAGLPGPARRGPAGPALAAGRPGVRR